MACSLRFYGDGISFRVVFSQSFWLRVLPGGACLVQSRWMPERRILGGGRTCRVSFWPFLNSSSWWWLISSMFLSRTSCHKTTHANGYYGAWPGWAVSVSVLPLPLSMNIHCWMPLGLTGLISLLSKGLKSPTLYDPMDCSPPGSSIHGTLQARILKWVAIPFSRESFWSRDWTQVFCIAGRSFTVWTTRDFPWLFYYFINIFKTTYKSIHCFLYVWYVSW